MGIEKAFPKNEKKWNKGEHRRQCRWKQHVALNSLTTLCLCLVDVFTVYNIFGSII